VGGRIAALQREVGVSVRTLPVDDPRRIAFEEAHRLSNLLLGASVAGGLVLIFWEARERRP
jgi:hypothetical protein